MQDYIGHRKRLRKKFLDGNGVGIADYEILEMILFLAHPRGDTKPTAKNMLSRFQTLNNVLYAQDSVLKELPSVGENTIFTIKLIREFIRRVFLTSLQNKNIFSSFLDVINYCQATMSNLIVEEFHVLYLNTKNQLIADEIQQRGTIDKTVVYSREVIKKALDRGAASIILVHNHPSGDPEPSSEDILTTTSIAEAGSLFNIKVLDHIIIGRYQHRSLKSMGVL